MFELGELERDALIEVLNIGMGKAAASLSEMVDDVIQLTVPSVDFMSRNEASGLLAEQTSASVAAIVPSSQSTPADQALYEAKRRGKNQVCYAGNLVWVLINGSPTETTPSDEEDRQC